MSMYRNRVCIVCGDIKFTAAKSGTCLKCHSEIRYAESRNRIKNSLELLGHTDVKFVGINKQGKVAVSFLHPVCGTEQIWQASNITKRLVADPNTAPCSKCGGKRRTAEATKAYKEKYGLDESRIDEWEVYRSITRRLTEVTYKKFIDEINPKRLKRALGASGFHLDHKTPIIFGFLNNIPAEHIAAKENLQMLTGPDNMSKGRRAS